MSVKCHHSAVGSTCGPSSSIACAAWMRIPDLYISSFHSVATQLDLAYVCLPPVLCQPGRRQGGALSCWQANVHPHRDNHQWGFDSVDAFRQWVHTYLKRTVKTPSVNAAAHNKKYAPNCQWACQNSGLTGIYLLMLSKLRASTTFLSPGETKTGFNSRCRSSPIKRLEYVHNYICYIFVPIPRVDRACRLTCPATVL